MRIVLFYHSLLSDWNHGNAHFLRGIATELQARGHYVDIYEPRQGWSLQNLVQEHGKEPLNAFKVAYPGLHSTFYDLATLNLNHLLADADLVIVHEWNEHELVARIGQHRARNAHYRLLFHDTHHRSRTEPKSMAAYDLSHYDGVLAYGQVIRHIYLKQRWAQRVWVWHEAADIRIFHPIAKQAPSEERGDDRGGDLVWIGNWGDGERTAQLSEFVFEPIEHLGLQAQVYGVRYPQEALATLAAAGIDYRGWLPNYQVPEVFARFRVTVHVPRQPYVEALPGIPTIRVFEALACGIPLICSPWEDSEHLFTSGRDYWVARNGAEMEKQLRHLLSDQDAAQALAAHGRRTILARHTCAHRVDELLQICAELGMNQTPTPLTKKSPAFAPALQGVS